MQSARNINFKQHLDKEIFRFISIYIFTLSTFFFIYISLSLFSQKA